MKSNQEDESIGDSEAEENGYEIGISDFLYIVGLFCLGGFYLLLLLSALVGATISKGLIHFMIDQISTNPRRVDFCNNDMIIPDDSKTYYVDWSRDDYSIIEDMNGDYAQIQGTDQLHLLEVEQIAWIWCLIFSFCFPEFLVFIKSLKEVIVNNSVIVKSKVSLKTQFGIVLVFELLHTVGLAVLIFAGLPHVDTIQAIAITSCMGIIPFLISFVNKHICRNKKPNIRVLALDVTAIAFQLSGILIWPILTGRQQPWSLTLGLILTSFAWWESFVSSSNLNFKFITFLSQIKTAMNSGTRYWLYMVISLLKISIFIGTAVILCKYNGLILDYADLFNKFNDSFSSHFYKVRESLSEMIGNDFILDKEYMALLQTSPSFPFWVLAVQILSSLITYGISVFVCKVRMEQLIFALPLSLTSPFLLNAIFIFCGMKVQDPCSTNDFFPRYVFFQCPSMNNTITYIMENQIWFWFLWFASQLWITKHIWKSATIRLASIEQIFCKPFYSGMMLDQSLLMNKRVDAFIKTDEKSPTIVYGCVTLWHETKTEMQSLVQSLVRMDSYNDTQTYIMKHKKNGTNDYFKWETHIIFDDAFQYGGNDGSKEQERNIIDEMGSINSFVHNLIDILEKECGNNKLPTVAPTPFGGRLTWTLPLGTQIICHLKDRFKIKKKKRWSQIMYMNYLIKYQHKKLKSEGYNHALEDTYLLALDGDMDFHPEAVTMLLDLMKKNVKTGAVCGRIHPLGSGVMKWYQSFEYAIGHWLQKSTEHIMGCVLCSPGCFSLFRSSSINGKIMKTYATESMQPKDFVQYDQGEDRWLCTLLLQNGYRVSYAAVCDAYTFVPEAFDDFFKQRRRWMPSTMANVVDLLFDYKNVIRVNKDISYFYIGYQIMLLIGTILGPGSIFLLLIGSFSVAFKISNTSSLIFNIIPIILFMIICYKYSSNDKIQLLFAQVLSVLYSLIMMAVLVGMLLQITEDGWLAPTTLSLLLVATSFILAALMHPKEILCLPCGLIYYVTIPSMYLLLVIYSIFNLNVISWGTRETGEASSTKDSKSTWRDAVLRTLMKFLKGEEKKTVAPSNSKDSVATSSSLTIPQPTNQQSRRFSSIGMTLYPSEDNDDTEEDEYSVRPRNYLENPHWMDNTIIKKCNIDNISDTEIGFWNDTIETYLSPEVSKDKILEDRLETNKSKQKLNNAAEQKKGLETLRNQVVLTFIILNSLFVVTVFLLQEQKNQIFINWPLDALANITFIRYQNSVAIDISYEYLKLEPIGLVFIAFFCKCFDCANHWNAFTSAFYVYAYSIHESNKEVSSRRYEI
ncbi:chitin synthase chs-2 isoform X2 [Lepeophtheirus salmonis]|uniref:chitin synthase chs-2 isoform X2 n=1 Tax=Lepeophtheirus salmonis TaxID=72036 RepID=UPI001AE7931B|nr:chitin synthase chs-2-like isoform X2 [Lepeophtheirus salmonis]